MKLLEILREEQQSMALVVDEYGEIQGLVTISDLMGAVLGRLQAGEEHDEDALVVDPRGRFAAGRWRPAYRRPARTDRRTPARCREMATTHTWPACASPLRAHPARRRILRLGRLADRGRRPGRPRIDKLLLQRMPDALADAVDA
jgi:hypothetical protein